jgi:hypothetical protein
MTKPAGSIAAAMNGSPQATTGRATCAIGQNATGFILGRALLGLLDERLERELLTYGPYFFPDLVGTTGGDEQAAIDAGQIRPTRIDYVGTRH